MELEVVNRFRSFKLSDSEGTGVELCLSDVQKSTEDCAMSLVGKIFGENSINLTGLKQTMMKLWCAEGTLQFVEIKNKMYQFIFSLEEERKRVLERRPWSFENQLLILQPWAKGIDQDTSAFLISQIWVQAWHIPAQWFSTATAWKIGKVFHQCHNVFTPEYGSKEGRYVKLLVDIDVTKPLVRGINICFEGEKQWVAFKYEHLPLFCFYCGRIGHGERLCEQKVQDLKREELEEGQFGEWLKAPTVRIGGRGRLWDRKDNSAERKSKPAILGPVEMGREELRQQGRVQQFASTKNVGMMGDKLVEESDLGGKDVQKDRSDGMVGTETGCSSVSHTIPGLTGKENQLGSKMVEEGHDEDHSLNVLRELDQNIPPVQQEARSHLVKGGTWKRKNKPESMNSTVIMKESLDQDVNRSSSTSKRKFCLVDEVDDLDSLAQNGKKNRMDQQDVNMLETLVEEASHKWPQVDQ